MARGLSSRSASQILAMFLVVLPTVSMIKTFNRYKIQPRIHRQRTHKTRTHSHKRRVHVTRSNLPHAGFGDGASRESGVRGGGLCGGSGGIQPSVFRAVCALVYGRRELLATVCTSSRRRMLVPSRGRVLMTAGTLTRTRTRTRTMLVKSMIEPMCVFSLCVFSLYYHRLPYHVRAHVLRNVLSFFVYYKWIRFAI
ncbi:hypothetical protein DFH11DRAFT_240293 [Phellopilus nigrolimitatus]|nr:hypothetical protein DFH11DRAFT_240293 [Phellopilus nigrolimitatus]